MLTLIAKLPGPAREVEPRLGLWKSDLSQPHHLFVTSNIDRTFPLSNHKSGDEFNLEFLSTQGYDLNPDFRKLHILCLNWKCVWFYLTKMYMVT